MRQPTIWLATAVSVLLTAMQTASAGSISCGVHRIQDDTRTPVTRYEVLKKCGEPKYRDGDAWIYHKGGVDITVTFKSGMIASIRQ